MMLTLVYAYYRNPDMFRRQLMEWGSYPEAVRAQTEFIVTDDCSPKGGIEFCIKDIPKGINLKLYRITEKVPWNWLACRNIGAHHARGKRLLLTDMDHLVSVGNAQKIMTALPTLDKRRVYLFTRVSAPKLDKYKPHDDSYLMRKDLFWQIGGYDEDLAGHYGTSGRYRRRVAKKHKLIRLNIPLIRYGREVIYDASTTDFERKLPDQAHQAAIIEIEMQKLLQGRDKEIKTLSFPYEEIKI
jgi:glycosyltransferase involved in cell wall biosynthesis